MKRFIVFLLLFFCSAAHADTETINWYMDDNIYATTTCESGGDITLPTAPTKYGYTFQGWSTYTPIEYLESTGTQWIDTGYRYTNTIKAKMRIARANTTRGSIFGYRFVNSATGDGNMRFFFVYEDGSIGIRFGDGFTQNTSYSPPATNSVVQIGINEQVELELSTTERKIYLNGTPVVQALEEYQPAFFGNIYFFTANTTGFYNVDVMSFEGKAYYLQIYDNDILVRDFIPVLDGNGVPCMYDRVEKKYYYNAGTGDFIAGPVIGG
ncbi:MAG: InlB B-repeat-containing protein [Alphaproteobacteria bacterium]|nr:InlB B-repeat-containing protein [Alphaproteobacteria bacterium]